MLTMLGGCVDEDENWEVALQLKRLGRIVEAE